MQIILCYDYCTMVDTTDLGQILVLLINYADERDIKQLILNCYSEINKDEVYESQSKTFKEYLIYKLCIAHYSCYEYIYEGNLESFRKILKKQNIEALILHLIALLKGFNNFLFLEKGLDNIDIKKLKKATQYKKGIVKIALKGNITEKDIPKILHLLINNYSQYGVYYEYLDENTIQRLKVRHHKNRYPMPNSNVVKILEYYDFDETLYEIKKCTNYTVLTNKTTGKELKINGRLDITPFYINKSGKKDIQAVDFDDFQKINNAICKVLANDTEKVPCVWCNPNESIKSAMCPNCRNLFEELQHYQEKALIDNSINIREEIKKIKFGRIKSLKTLLEKRKKFILDLINSPNCKLDEEEVEQIKYLSNRSFG